MEDVTALSVAGVRAPGSSSSPGIEERRGMVVSGGRDRSICGWSARTGKFLFARYSREEGGWWLAEDLTALSVAGVRAPGSSSSPGIVESRGMVVSGGRDRSICGWSARTGKFLFARYSRK